MPRDGCGYASGGDGGQELAALHKVSLVCGGGCCNLEQRAIAQSPPTQASMSHA
jgi:hypothetical protein